MATPYPPQVREYDFRGVEVEGAGRMTLPMELRHIDQGRAGRRRDNGLALAAAGCILISALIWAWWLAPW